MPDLRTTLVLLFQNRFREKIRKLKRKDARIAFEKHCHTLPLPLMQSVHNDMVENVPIRIYQPRDANKSVTVFFHGGGFIYGSIQSHDQFARLLAKYTGQTIISVGYSLAPEARFPKQINEAISVLASLDKLSSKYDFDTQHISLAGDSAGGFIALQAAMRYTTKPLSHLVLIYPSVSPHHSDAKSMISYREGFFITANDARLFWKDFLGDQPITPYTETSVSNIPTTLIITAEYDVLRSEAHHLHNLLRNTGKPSTYVNYKGMIHGFMQIPWPLSKRRKVFRRIARFMQQY